MGAYASVTSAGFAATAITYGPARMGFGLFLNDFRTAFEMSAGTAGLISALGFFGFFIALPAGYVMAARRSPRTPVLFGLACATFGMALIAAAPSPPVLAAGAVLAMASAGLSWAPFNLAVNRRLAESDRPGALSIVSTGTSAGVVAAALTALAVSAAGGSWRLAWAGFALAGALAGLAVWRLMRGARHGAGAPPGARRRLAARRTWPLHLTAFTFGALSTVYISFAADAIARAEAADGVFGGPAGWMFAGFGLAGLAGLAAGRLGRRVGLARVLRGVFLACAMSFAILAAARGALPLVLISAGFQGAFVMMISAALAFWTERLFPDLPSMSFTAALLAMAAGSVAGPLGAGYAVDAFGFTAVFAGAAGLAALAALLIAPRPPGAETL